VGIDDGFESNMFILIDMKNVTWLSMLVIATVDKVHPLGISPEDALNITSCVVQNSTTFAAFSKLSVMNDHR